MPDNKFANSFAAIRQASGPDEPPTPEEMPADAAPAGSRAVGAVRPTPAAASGVAHGRAADSARPGGPPGAPMPPLRRRAHTPVLDAAPTAVTSPTTAPERRGPGRPPGKRSDPEYRQVTGLIRRDVHVAVLKQMLDEGRSRDMGALLEELLEHHYLKAPRRDASTT